LLSFCLGFAIFPSLEPSWLYKFSFRVRAVSQTTFHFTSSDFAGRGADNGRSDDPAQSSGREERKRCRARDDEHQSKDRSGGD
jgi:hypothetical protein